MKKLFSLSHKRISLIKFRALYIPTHQEFQPKTNRTPPSTPSISSNPLFSLLGLVTNLSSLHKVHASLIVHNLSTDILFQTKLVSLYGQFRELETARQVFDKIPHPNLYSCRVMIRWYFLHDLYWEVIGFYTQMRNCLIEHDNVVFSIVLQACSVLREIDEGRKLHCQIVKVGNPDGIVLTGLVDMYCKCGKMDCSREVFEDICDKSVVSWTSMIVCYVQNDYALEGLMMFNQMRDRLVEGNEYTFVSVITACAKLHALHQGKWVHGYLIKKGIDINSFLLTSLLDMYVKCGNIRDARFIYDELGRDDLVSWTAMIVGYAQSGHPHEALKLFIDRTWEGMLPNSVTIASLVSACAQSVDLELGRQVHCLGVKLGFKDGSVFNALIDMYAKCRSIADALKLLGYVHYQSFNLENTTEYVHGKYIPDKISEEA